MTFFIFFPFFFAARLGKRHLVTFMIFLGMANAYVMRTNMSVAIVAMVNHTAIKRTEEIVIVERANECGERITNETEAAQRVSTPRDSTRSCRGLSREKVVETYVSLFR